MTKRKLVLAFIFNSSLSHILLIHKNRPEWQKGKINGIGGKLKDGETKLNGITREVMEETTLDINKWIYLGRMHEESKIIYMYTAVYPNKDDAHSATDEKVEWFEIKKLPQNIISNLGWLIPMSKDVLENKSLKKIEVFNS